jgi:hypothetical protein
MTFNRKLWLEPFSFDQAPAWPCPGCGSGTLEIKRDSWQYRISAASRAAMDHECDLENTSGVVICFFDCSRADCSESCAVAGHYSTKFVSDSDRNPVSIAVCTPTMIDPPPPIIRLPAKCPEPVRREASRAFTLFWADYAACLNSIRHAIELVLTDLWIPLRHRVTDKKSGGIRVERFLLHQRIERLQKQRPRLASLCARLMAVKHLGNAGSHPGDVSAEDALDGFEIVEEVLASVYGDAGRLDRTVKEINRRRGPRRQ